MCGIIGINSSNEEAVRKAAGTFSYRGPDGFGLFSDERVTLGHNRLSIIDLNFRSNQPFFDSSGEIGIIFNGEIYNFKDLRDELDRLGQYNFRTTSDTEVMVYAYKQWGIKFVEKLRGMFAFAIYDKHLGKLVLASDVSAIKPIYFAHTNGIFVFASEIKGVLSLLKQKGLPTPSIDPGAVDLYFANGYVPAPNTLYTSIKRFKPKTIISYDLATDNLTEDSFDYNLEKIDESMKSLNEVINDSVKAHLVSDVPIGVFFSGGTDSSLITAIMKKMNFPIQAFSVAISGRMGDKKYFNAIAKHLDIRSHIINFDQKAFNSSYNEVLALIDEPIASNSILPMYAVSKYAAKYVKVVLSGEGGDEFFYGYNRSRILNKMTPSFRKRIGILEQLYLHLPSFTGKNRLFEYLFILFFKPVSYYLLTMSPSRDLLNPEAWKRAYRNLSEAGTEPNSFDSDWYLPNDLLRKIDLSSMYASIEGRVPLVDREVIRAAKLAKLSDINLRVLKPELKKVLINYLPEELVYRKKSGFGLHLPIFFEQSETVRLDLETAISNLNKRNILPLKKIPEIEKLMKKYPNLAWAIIVLDRVIRNNNSLE